MEHKGTCSFEQANWISKLTFWWMNPLFTAGRRNQLPNNNTYDVVSADKSCVVVTRLEKAWNKELASARVHQKNPSLFKAILLAFKTECLFNGVFIFIAESMGILQPFLIGKLLGYFEPGSNMSSTEVYVIAAALGVSGLTKLIIDPWYFFLSQHLDMRIKAAVSCLIYRKVLRVSSLSLQSTTSGKIVNHLSTDVEKFTEATGTLHFVWVAPLVLFINMYLIYQNVGTASLFMLPVFVALVPFELLVGRLLGRLRMKVGARTDKRIYAMNEIITGMKVIKMYCWEKPFSKVIAQLRKAEVKQIWFTLVLKCLHISIVIVSSRILCMTVFVAAWQLNVPLSTSIIFSIMGWMEGIRLVVFLFTGLMVERTVQIWASMKRIQSFLEEAEIHEEGKSNDKNNTLCTRNDISDCAVEIYKMMAVWTDNKQSSSSTGYDNRGKQNMAVDEVKEELFQPFTLRDIDLNIKKGELVAVVGAVGSGKSSLVMALLGELPATKGHIKVNGTIGYVSQQPWVVSGTVRNNILFGQEFDSGKYSNVIYACALEKDTKQMSHGDMTLVGERGLLLSGGQKARLTLARTAYTDCDIYLLDDPLGAVDTEVGKHLFNKCIREYLKGKTRILVTHQLQYLSEVDRIIVFKEGRIVSVGKYEELASNNDEFSSMIRDDDVKGKEKEFNNENTDTQVITKSEGGTEQQEEEDIQTGTVGWRVYRDYIASGYPFVTVPLILILIILTQASMVVGDWYLAKWGDLQDALYSGGMGDTSSQRSNKSSTECQPSINTSTTLLEPNQTTPSSNPTSSAEVSTGGNFIYIYIMSVVLYIFVALLFGLAVFRTLNIAGKQLHNKMFVKIIGAKARLFDSNPVGRILNRFARDLGLIDDLIPFQTFVVLEIGFRTFAILIVTCVVNPLLLIPLCPVVIFIFFLRQYATSTTRHLKRIEAVTRSPVFSHVSDTLHGLQTIRALNKSDDFIKEFDGYQDQHTIAAFIYFASFRWFSVRSMSAVGIYFIFVIVISLILKDSFGITGGLYGLSLSYVLMIGTPFEFMMRQSAHLETHMTSVERITAYTKLEQEAEITSNQPPPTSWPKEGQITFQNVSLRYSDSSPVVLHELNCTINGKEKIGIVGRTGAGKSSIVTAVLRLAEPTGSITVDNVDIQTIGLHELRAKISVIPQDPILFGGTLRYNLDPFEEYDDDNLWDSLEQVQLKTKVEGLTGQLYAEMSEGGNNFSVGQRQLVCLARAVLHNNKILILDEATANVDIKTDEMIQRTIRERFKNCTVLTIAHRLNTIMDSDRIMVLDNGLLKEFDVPYRLLQYKNGYFRNLVDQTGHTQALLLQSLAEKAHKNESDH